MSSETLYRDFSQLPVVLVGQGTGDFWQAFGEPRGQPWR